MKQKTLSGIFVIIMCFILLMWKILIYGIPIYKRTVTGTKRKRESLSVQSHRKYRNM